MKPVHRFHNSLGNGVCPCSLVTHWPRRTFLPQQNEWGGSCPRAAEPPERERLSYNQNCGNGPALTSCHASLLPAEQRLHLGELTLLPGNPCRIQIFHLELRDGSCLLAVGDPGIIFHNFKLVGGKDTVPSFTVMASHCFHMKIFTYE
jgi:hypothetical protein